MLHDIGILHCHAPKILCTGTEHYLRHGLIGGGMLRDLQMYCIRFLVFFGISAFAGAVDVLLRLLFGSVFSAAAGT